MMIFTPAPEEKEPLLERLESEGWGLVYVSPQPLGDGRFRVTAVEPVEEQALRARVDAESYRSELEHCRGSRYTECQTPHEAKGAAHA